MEPTTMKPSLSLATTKRLPLYLRSLKKLEGQGVERINSSELSREVQVSAATIRRDFSYFGELGKSGYGYDIHYLIQVFNAILETKEEKRIALIGCGNLGQALMTNNFRRNENLTITAVFDNDPEKIGQTICGYYVHPMDELESLLKELEIHIAISTVPSQYTQEAVDQLTEKGITAILNFAPVPVEVPKGVHVHTIDLTSELQTLIYLDGR